VDLIQGEGQARWALDDDRRKPNSHALVALQSGEVIGFLTFTVQPISRSEGGPVLCEKGVPLTEGYVQTFGVREDRRGHGIGTALQEAALRRVRELGCYQLRSWSDVNHPENYAIKLKLGFAAHPAIYHSERTGEDYEGVYWVTCVRDTS
jgi:GNAT superfamily N-acetyltransferase